MKILIVASYNKKRFAPFVVEQAEALQQTGCKVDWFGVRGKGLLGYLKVIPHLRNKIREFQPDVIHAHYGLSCLLANLATRQVPVVSTYHGSDINVKTLRHFSKVAMWLSAWNIFVSKRNMALAGAVEGMKCSLIPCGINLPMLWSELKDQKIEHLTLIQWVETIMPQGKKYVLFAGAFDNTVKDPELAKQAMNALANEGVNAELVELKGYNRDQVNALMYNCNAFLMTSKTEGSPQVIKEAMACGCPIVSVDVGDVAERTEGLAGCYIVPSRESKDIAAALKKALSFEGRTNGRKRIIEMELTNEQVAKRIVEIYKEYVRKSVN